MGALPSNLDSEPAIAIEHATVIDVQTGERKGDQTILIAGNHIAGVASATSFVVPARARRVDGTGSFVIPGLWEMHAHTYRSLDLVGALHLANGVTGIRDMGSRIGEQPVLALRDSIRAGRVPGPRMVVAGGLPPPSPAGAPSSGEPITEKNVRAAVDSLARMGVDFIKLVSLSAPAFLGAIDAARANGLRAVGHLPWRLDIRVASDAGARSREHLWGFLTACSTREEELRAAIAGWVESSNGQQQAWAEGNFASELIASRDAAKCAQLHARLARNRTFIGPTLLVARQLGWPDEFDRPDDPQLRFLRVCRARAVAGSPIAAAQHCAATNAL